MGCHVSSVCQEHANASEDGDTSKCTGQRNACDSCFYRPRRLPPDSAEALDSYAPENGKLADEEMVTTENWQGRGLGKTTGKTLRFLSLTAEETPKFGRTGDFGSLGTQELAEV
eukprot:TRINITY_DN24262_c0_g1_i1.p2 TRINITY_DN24262_c0_g1~~TRINITY_DN24262_c0_g1_i1.p2  ORF type:complete len:114 (+),score=22.48 TRINITY_DN24262_c0_g1_i1:58-399(+)